MKKVKISWTEREVIEYDYEEEFEVEDNFVINTDNLIDFRWATKDCYYSKNTNYRHLDNFIEEDGRLNILDIEIESYEEILPPSPEEKKAEYLQLLAEMNEKIAGMTQVKERILKLVNQNKS